jgi:hypothetical protein
VVLQQGRIVERGTYATLKKAGGVFAGLLEEQSRYSAERLAHGRGRVVVAAPALAGAVVDALRPPAPAPPSADEQLDSILADLRTTIDQTFHRGNGHGNGNGNGNGNGRGMVTLHGKAAGAGRARGSRSRMEAEVADALSGGDDDPPASILPRRRRRD